MIINSIATLPRLPLRFSPCILDLFRLLQLHKIPALAASWLHSSISIPENATEARSLIDPNIDQKWPHSRFDSHWSTVLCSGSYRHIPGGNRDRGRHIFREDWR